MPVNRGKKFEDVVKQAFERVPYVSVDRLHDQTTGYLGSSNICDFIVYRKPYEFYFECKSVHGNTLSIHSITKDPKHPHDYGNITNKQWEGLSEKAMIDGVFAGVICWWIDHDVTMFLPIDELARLYLCHVKSVHYDFDGGISIHGTKKRVFFDYDMQTFLDELELR